MTVHPHSYGEPVLLAVSGGVDSSVMARIFHNSGVGFAIAHCNFHLRGEESEGDAGFVEEMAKSFGRAFFRKDFDTMAFARDNGVSVEMAARELRYRWFDRLCREEKFSGVCVAHNANDNAETLILNLLRGCGLKGLCGMAEKSVNPYGSTFVFRPLLACTREEIESYASDVGMVFRTDSTNLLSDCRRNLIRNEVFPLLRQLNPSFIRTFARDIGHFRTASLFVEQALSTDWERLSKELEENSSIDLKLLQRSGGESWKLLIYRVMEDRGFSPAVISELVRLIESGDYVAGKTFMSPSCRVVTGRGSLQFAAANMEDKAPTASFSIERLDWDGSMSPVCPRGSIIVDSDKLGSGQPVIRPWKAGDWLCPLGMGGKKKVSDLLTDLHYSLIEKESALVLEGSGSHVLALVGERIDESVKVDSSTKSVYRISISKGSRA